MNRVFEIIAPYLEEGSWLQVLPDSGIDIQIVQNGKEVEINKRLG